MKYAQVFIGGGDEGGILKYLLTFKNIIEGNSNDAEAEIRRLIDGDEIEQFGSDMSKSTSYVLLAVMFQAAYEEEPESHNLMCYAKESYLDALKIEPKNITALDGLVTISFQIGKAKDAKKYLDKIYEIFKDNTINGKYGWS